MNPSMNFQIGQDFFSELNLDSNNVLVLDENGNSKITNFEDNMCITPK